MNTNNPTVTALIDRIQSAAQDLASYMPPLAHHLNGIAAMAGAAAHYERLGRADSFLAGTDAVSRAVNLMRRMEGREPVDFSFPLGMGEPSREQHDQWSGLRDRLDAALLLGLLQRDSEAFHFAIKGRNAQAHMKNGHLCVTFAYSPRAEATAYALSGALVFTDLTAGPGEEPFSASRRAACYELLIPAAELLLALPADALNVLQALPLVTLFLGLYGETPDEDQTFCRLMIGERELLLICRADGSFVFRCKEWAQEASQLSLSQRAQVKLFLDEYAAGQKAPRQA